MKRVTASCPSCGGPVEFKTSASLLSVCPSCGSAVARGDRSLEDFGKVAALVQTNSPLRLGDSGRFHNHPFQILGHIQYQHPAGGVWDEWYVSFPGDKWCWIAEAQGKLYLTQKKTITGEDRLPDWESLRVGQSLPLGMQGTFVISEVNEAHVRGAEGELPFLLKPGASYRFADLSGEKQGFATLGYDAEGVTVFVGREVTLGDLGLKVVEPGDAESKQISGVGVRCPQCGGTLELKAPDETQRVTCPYCASLLDVNQGNLRYLSTLSLKIQPDIPIGTQGQLDGIDYTVIGFMRRAVYFDREYTWDEYLLFAPGTGFRWLVQSDRHWSFVEPVPAADVQRGQVCLFRGQRFKLFQRAWARVVHVLGEFYWKVEVGETVLAEDYIAPPKMITLEMTPVSGKLVGNAGSENWELTEYSELNASLATYLPHETIETAFGLKEKLPRGFSVAPNQPAPDYSQVYWMWPAFVAVCVLSDVLVSTAKAQPPEHLWTVLAVVAISIVPVGVLLFSHSFERNRWADSEFNPYDTG